MLKNLQDLLIEQLYLFPFPKRIDALLSGQKLFFIVGMGRSGTTFLANLLRRAPGASVYHETKGDSNALVEAYWDLRKGEKYIQGTRKRLIAARVMQSHCQVYGEVNSLLRFHVDALRNLGSPIILHLVRDGRNVVRSGMNRNTFTPADKRMTGRLRPHIGDPYDNRWNTMDRFARMCWYWASTINYLLQLQVPTVRFEDLIGSYEQFKNQILEPLGLEISREHWQGEIRKPKNATEQKTFPVWEDWTLEQKCQFLEICGNTMLALRYEI